MTSFPNFPKQAGDALFDWGYDVDDIHPVLLEKTWTDPESFTEHSLTQECI